jgi:hypothetical protein
MEEALLLVESFVTVTVWWKEVDLSEGVSDKIKEIRDYIECLVVEKKINWNDLYKLNQDIELQNIYDSLESVWIKKFKDKESYDMWKKYILTWNIPIALINEDLNEWLDYGIFLELTFDELADLEDILLKSNNASLKVEIWPKAKDIIKH